MRRCSSRAGAGSGAWRCAAALPRRQEGCAAARAHDAEDLIAALFPDQLACAENLVGEREIPDHPLVGILTPAPKLSALTGNRVLYRNGVPVALLAVGDVQFLEMLDAGSEWEARKALLRGGVPASLVDLA